jgi:hypothetical protein
LHALQESLAQTIEEMDAVKQQAAAAEAAAAAAAQVSHQYTANLFIMISSALSGRWGRAELAGRGLRRRASCRGRREAGTGADTGGAHARARARGTSHIGPALADFAVLLCHVVQKKVTLAHNMLGPILGSLDLGNLWRSWRIDRAP